MSTITSQQIRLAALGLLASREYSVVELKQKLTKTYPDSHAQIEDQVNQLTSEGLQSDARVCESLIRSRIGKGQGPVKIRADLRSRGISDEEILQGFNDAQVDWLDVIRDVKQRKYGDAQPTDMKYKARIVRFLQQRGFTFEQINRLF